MSYKFFLPKNKIGVARVNFKLPRILLPYFISAMARDVWCFPIPYYTQQWSEIIQT